MQHPPPINPIAQFITFGRISSRKVKTNRVYCPR